MKWLSIFCLAGCTTTTRPADVVGPFSRTVHRYVVTSLKLPADRTQEAADLNGDGKLDNQLGNIVGLLHSGENDVKSADDLIAAGVLSSSVEIAGDDLTNGIAGVRYLGKDGDASDFAGGRFGELTPGFFHSNRTALTTHPAAMTLRIPLFIDVDPLLVQVVGAQIDLVPSGSGYDGQLNGGVRIGDADSLTAMGTLQMIAADPYDHPAVYQIFDTNHDGVITDEEILDNALIKNVLYPDVTLFDSGGNWSPDPRNRNRTMLSFGIGFHLEPCETGRCDLAQPEDHCHDRARDGDESDLDCGGSCRTCLDGFACAADSDCHSGKCDHGSCAGTSCSNLVQDGDETGLDCGGTCPVKCQQGYGCRSVADCAPGLQCVPLNDSLSTCR